MKAPRQKKLNIKIPKTKGSRGLGALPHVNAKKMGPQQRQDYTKKALQEDPMQYTGFGYYVP